MRLSVVLPLFNEVDNLGPLYERLRGTLERIACDYELIFVNDGSTDGSLEELERLCDRDSHVKFISLSRNFGHEIASTAGLDAADGDAVVLMDADLQDPPELIERLIEPWLQGFDVVYARRVKRHGEGAIKRTAAFLFYRLMRRVSSVDLPLDTGDFRLMDRRVVEAFRQFHESQRFVRGLVSWMGFRQTAVDYERPARHAGIGKYSAWQLLKLAGDAVFGFSTLPLRLALVTGALCVTGSIAAAAIALARSWASGVALDVQWLIIVCVVLFSGVQLLGLGILGEYVGRIQRDTLRRPLYLVDRQHGWRDTRADELRRRTALNSTSSISSASSAAPRQEAA